MKEIKLTNSHKTVLVDDEDYQWILNLGNIGLHSTNKYASHGKNLLHRLIYEKYNLKIKNNIDHIDGNGLNNQKNNLRDVDQHINGFNRQNSNKQKKIKYRGVFWIKNRKRWNCLIYSNKKCVYSEYFDTSREAAIAYDIFVSKFLSNIYVSKNCPDAIVKEINNVLQIISNPKKNKGNSKYKGVSYNINRNKWRSYTKLNGKQIHFGWFKTEEEAKMCLDKNIK